MANFKSKLKWRKWGLAALFIFICLIWYIIAGSDMRFSDKEIGDFFVNEKIDYSIHRVDFGSSELRYIETGLELDSAGTVIIFIHGAPGSSDAFHSYISDSVLLEKATLIAVDRPGYGYSDYGNPTVSIVDQAEAVMSIINKIKARKIILVSHSYGCAIAGVIAVNLPDLVSANILVCPVIDPLNEKIFFFSSWSSLPIIKHLFSGAMQVSSFEKMNHADELKSIEYLWSQTKVPTVLFHGRQDWIAPVENAYYLNDKISSEFLTVDLDDEASHFILWKEQDKIVQKIIEFL